jgi:hypothetical protein
MTIGGISVTVVTFFAPPTRGLDGARRLFDSDRWAHFPQGRRSWLLTSRAHLNLTCRHSKRGHAAPPSPLHSDKCEFALLSNGTFDVEMSE